MVGRLNGSRRWLVIDDPFRTEQPAAMVQMLCVADTTWVSPAWSRRWTFAPVKRPGFPVLSVVSLVARLQRQQRTRWQRQNWL